MSKLLKQIFDSKRSKENKLPSNIVERFERKANQTIIDQYGYDFIKDHKKILGINFGRCSSVKANFQVFTSRRGSLVSNQSFNTARRPSLLSETIK